MFRNLTVRQFVEKAVALSSHAAHQDGSGLPGEEPISGTKRHVMWPPVTCRADNRLCDVIEVLAQHAIHRIHVVDQENCLVGVVSLRDIISRFVSEPPGYFDDYLGEILRADNGLDR